MGLSDGQFQVTRAPGRANTLLCQPTLGHAHVLEEGPHADSRCERVTESQVIVSRCERVTESRVTLLSAIAHFRVSEFASPWNVFTSVLREGRRCGPRMGDPSPHFDLLWEETSLLSAWVPFRHVWIRGATLPGLEGPWTAPRDKRLWAQGASRSWAPTDSQQEIAASVLRPQGMMTADNPRELGGDPLPGKASRGNLAGRHPHCSLCDTWRRRLCSSAQAVIVWTLKHVYLSPSWRLDDRDPGGHRAGPSWGFCPGRVSAVSCLPVSSHGPSVCVCAPVSFPKDTDPWDWGPPW